MNEINNLKELEDAFKNGLKKEGPICLIMKDKEVNAVFLGKRKFQGEIIITTVEENCGMIERGLYKIKKDGIDYQGSLDAQPEDASRITKLKDELYEKLYRERK